MFRSIVLILIAGVQYSSYEYKSLKVVSLYFYLTGLLNRKGKPELVIKPEL